MHQPSILILCRAPKCFKVKVDERRWEENPIIAPKKSQFFTESGSYSLAFCGNILSLYQSILDEPFVELGAAKIPPPASSSHSVSKPGLSIPGCGGLHFRRPRWRGWTEGEWMMFNRSTDRHWYILTLYSLQGIKFHCPWQAAKKRTILEIESKPHELVNSLDNTSSTDIQGRTVGRHSIYLPCS